MTTATLNIELDSIPDLNAGKDLLLNTLKVEDAPALLELYSDADSLKYTDEKLHHSVQDSEDFIRNELKNFRANYSICWAIRRNSDSKFLGLIRIKQIDLKNHSAILGYYLKGKARGKGIATAVVGRIAEYAFSVLKLHRLEAQVYVRHASSIKILEKNGFEREGRLKENFLIQGKFRDSYQYGLVKGA